MKPHIPNTVYIDGIRVLRKFLNKKLTIADKPRDAFVQYTTT